MKHLNILNEKKHRNNFSSKSSGFLKMGIMLFAMLLSFSVMAQSKIKVGAGYSRWLTGSGAHLMHMPFGAVQYKAYGLNVSPNLGRKDKKISGANYEFRFSPKLKNANLDVFLNYTGILNYNIKVDYTNEMKFRRIAEDAVLNKSVSDFEHYVGFGVGKNLFDKFSLQTSIGVGYFKMNINESLQFSTPSLILKANILYL